MNRPPKYRKALTPQRKRPPLKRPLPGNSAKKINLRDGAPRHRRFCKAVGRIRNRFDETSVRDTASIGCPEGYISRNSPKKLYILPPFSDYNKKKNLYERRRPYE